jgi:hypothetical protein
VGENESYLGNGGEHSFFPNVRQAYSNRMPWVLYHQIENLLQRGFSRGKLAGFVQKSVVKVDTIDVMIGECVVQ